jgi:UDP-GlcNAc:undecaprenyl-phosphate GlcNAc-1-phosphate transferase
VAPLMRTNYAGRDVPTAGGIVAVLGFLAVAVTATTVDRFEFRHVDAVALLVLGFAVLGLLDDVVGNHSARGLRGHVAAVGRGQLTSGLVKLVFGLALAWLVYSGFEDWWDHALSAVVIAGAANVANLLDLAPGRAVKVAAVALVLFVVLSDHVAWNDAHYWFVFAAVALLPFEFGEFLMLGDTGANPLGAVIGLAAVRSTNGSTVGLAIAAGVVLAVNVAGEVVSFSSVIDRVPPLRVLDRMGRRR